MAAAAALSFASPTALGAASCCCGRSHGRYVPPSVWWWLQALTNARGLYPGQAHTCAMVAAANRGAHSKNAATQLATAAAAALAGGQAGATQVTLSKVQGQRLIAAQGKSKLRDNPSLVCSLHHSTACRPQLVQRRVCTTLWCTPSDWQPCDNMQRWRQCKLHHAHQLRPVTWYGGPPDGSSV